MNCTIGMAIRSYWLLKPKGKSFVEVDAGDEEVSCTAAAPLDPLTNPKSFPSGKTTVW